MGKVLRRHRLPRPGPLGARAWAGIALAAACFLLLAPQSVRPANEVDLILVLALDVSGSVDNREFELQRTGLVRAFRHPDVIEAITQGRRRRIAVMAVQWAGRREQAVAVPWAVIANAAGAARFAASLAGMRRRFAYPLGVTHIGGVIRFATRQALAAPYSAGRRVVDISGDGENNVRDQPQPARDLAVAVGMTINGLAILNEMPDLDAYYRAHVIGGPGAFVITANDYEDYARAIRLKLLREISQNFIM